MKLRQFLALSGAAAGGVYWLARYLRPQHSALILTDKVVLITGASTGIGRALAFAFARRGARVALVARNEERLEAVRREIEPYSADVLVVPADLTDEAQLESAVQRTLEHFGRIDVLVNNAGLSMGGPLVDLDPARMEQMLRLNLWAAVRLTHRPAGDARTSQRLHYEHRLRRGASRALRGGICRHEVRAGWFRMCCGGLGAAACATLVNPSWTATDMLTPRHGKFCCATAITLTMWTMSRARGERVGRRAA